MYVLQTIKNAERPEVPELGGLVVVEDSFFGNRFATYSPATGVVHYLNKDGSCSFDYFSVVASKCRGLRCGEALTVAA
jgi:hypothetical protein